VSNVRHENQTVVWRCLKSRIVLAGRGCRKWQPVVALVTSSVSATTGQQASAHSNPHSLILTHMTCNIVRYDYVVTFTMMWYDMIWHDSFIQLSACGAGLWQSLCIVLQTLLSSAAFYKSVSLFFSNKSINYIFLLPLVLLRLPAIHTFNFPSNTSHSNPSYSNTRTIHLYLQHHIVFNIFWHDILMEYGTIWHDMIRYSVTVLDTRLKMCIASSQRNPVSQLQGVTCHMGSHSYLPVPPDTSERAPP